MQQLAHSAAHVFGALALYSNACIPHSPVRAPPARTTSFFELIRRLLWHDVHNGCREQCHTSAKTRPRFGK